MNNWQSSSCETASCCSEATSARAINRIKLRFFLLCFFRFFFDHPTRHLIHISFHNNGTERTNHLLYFFQTFVEKKVSKLI